MTQSEPAYTSLSAAGAWRTHPCGSCREPLGEFDGIPQTSFVTFMSKHTAQQGWFHQNRSCRSNGLKQLGIYEAEGSDHDFAVM